MRKLAIAALAILSVGITQTAWAQVSLTTLNYSQNFDSMTPGGSGVFALGVVTDIPGLLSWNACKVNGTTSAGSFVSTDGSNATGAIQATRNSNSTEYSLGTLCSASYSVAAIGVEFVNNTGSALSSVTIRLVQENWRTSNTTLNVSDAMFARSSTSTATSTNFLLDTPTGFSNVNSLDLVGPTPVGTNVAIDGNNVANQAIRFDTITFSTPLAVGESLFLKWRDTDEGGSDASLSIDNFELSATAVPEPATMAVLALGAIATIRRRRNGR